MMPQICHRKCNGENAPKSVVDTNRQDARESPGAASGGCGKVKGVAFSQFELIELLLIVADFVLATGRNCSCLEASCKPLPDNLTASLQKNRHRNEHEI